MDIESNYKKWLSSPRLDEKSKQELSKMSEKEKADAFYKDIEFGTAGMRGVLGPGTNRMNSFTVGKAALGLGLYVIEKFADARDRGIVISHDNRLFSREFTLLSAEIFNKLGLKAYIFDDLRATPELSFAVRHLNCAAGVMITASHNPKEYNGFKVYDEKGCQMVPSKIERLIKILSLLPSPIDCFPPEGEFVNRTITLGKEVDDAYLELVKKTQVNPDLDKKDFTIVYSPQHGASYEGAMRVFKECGYNIIPVSEQCVHDPNFGATLSPNPEKEEAWVLSLEYARKHNADVCLMTDPDGDRCGLAFRKKDGTYARLTGNQSGALLIDYILGQKKEKGILPLDAVLYDTIVTSTQGEEVAKSYGVKVESFLTGFKYIGDRIAHYEEIGHGPTFVFGYEESYGCLLAPFVRDKDGIQAILLYAEMTLWHKRHGHTLDEAYEELQNRLGYHETVTKDIYFEGMEGDAKMKKLMSSLRETRLWEINGLPIKEIRDYLLDKVFHKDGKEDPIEGLPKSDVIKFFFEDGSTLAVRPSGTEPKVKFYVESVSKTKEGLNGKTEGLYQSITKSLGL